MSEQRTCEVCGALATEATRDMRQVWAPEVWARYEYVGLTHLRCAIHSREAFVYDLGGYARNGNDPWAEEAKA